MSDLFDGIQEVCAVPDTEARQLVLIEAAKSYSQVPQLAQALHKAARKVGEVADDLVEVLGQMSRQRKD